MTLHRIPPSSVATADLERVIGAFLRIGGEDVTPYVKTWTLEPVVPIADTRWTFRVPFSRATGRWLRRVWGVRMCRYPRLNGQRARGHHRPHRR